MDSEKEIYVKSLQVYHRKLETFLLQNYAVDTEYLEVISWGYHTTAVYIKAADSKEYLLKLAAWSKEKEIGSVKDVDLSNKLNRVIPTPIYIKNSDGDYICRFEDKILRLSYFISGLPPLDMNFGILEQMIYVLKKIHSVTPASLFSDRVPIPPWREAQILELRSGGATYLLHGDLTPHNVLVSFDKLVAVMDFELSFIGSREWDLARTAVFSWNYLKDESFSQVASFVLDKYADSTINTDLLYKYAVENAQKHLESVEKHKANYDRREDWARDMSFAKQRLVLLKS